MAFELRSVLCSFETSTKCSKALFDSDPLLEQLTGLLLAAFINFEAVTSSNF